MSKEVDIILAAVESGELPKSAIRVAEKYQQNENIIIRPGTTYSEYFGIPEEDAPAIMQFLEDNEIIRPIKPNNNE